MGKYYNEDGSYKRIIEIDMIRGFCILLVLFDHLMYNFAVANVNLDFFIQMKTLAIRYWYWDVRVFMQYVVVALFFAVSGISSSFSKNNFIRGAKIFFIAMGLTVVTMIYAYVANDPGSVIDFGVIHVFGVCILVFALVSHLKNIPLIAIAAVAIFLGWYIPTLEIQTTSKAFLMFGITPVGYVFGDYYSLFPWLGYFILGGVIGKMFYRERKSLFGEVAPKITKPILQMGRKSLYYYFGEMIILMPIFYLLYLAF
ncbi:MAG: heparan-alpha-glucosaminide N-acetyltransferase domain-containing protein [Bacillota bacterium]